MASQITLTFMFAIVCLASLVLAAPSSDANNKAADSDLLPFPSFGQECGPDEVAVPQLPECERTCSRPEPACVRLYIIMDHAQCFCKEGLVRDEVSKKCVKLADCPPKAN